MHEDGGEFSLLGSWWYGVRMFKVNDDKPYRVFFPEPVILHGTDEKRIVEVALEYLRQPGRIRIEPLFAPEVKK
jgi:hypothetical protein